MLVQILISGLTVGSIYALLGLALVLIHKATEVVNFAQGEMATFNTFVAFALLKSVGLPLPIVFLLGFPIGFLMATFIERIVIRPLTGSPPVNLLIVAIGLFIILNNTVGWIWGYDPYTFPSLLPKNPVDLLGARISPNSLGIIGVSLLLMAALYVFFEYTREGTAMRAASMNKRAAELMGIRVPRVSTMSWALAGGISMVSGMLVAPILFLDFEMMVSVLIKAFAGAILGGFNSLPGSVLGGLTIGVLENLFGAYVSTAFKDSFAFFVIIVVLMFRPAGLFTRSKA
jgi:branched-chain amino acid transport system permease protein